jgi:putative membrane protein
MRLRTNRIHVGMVAGALAAAALGACKKSSEYAANDTTALKADSAAGRTDSMAGRAMPMDSGTTSGKYAPANVLGYALVANNGEIALGKLGEKMASNPAVKSFARSMVADHEKRLAEVRQLSKSLSATPDTLAGDASDLRSHDADEIKDLNGKTKGADWDKAFIENAIEGHQKILDQLQDAAKNTPDATLRSSLEKVSGQLQQHITKAQDIKSNVLKD